MKDGIEIVKSGYNRIANAYLESRETDSADVILLDELIKKLPEGAVVLDAGCGAGVPVAQKLSQYYQVIGVDFAETQIKLAQELVPNAQFECQDLTNLSFPDATFDAICSYYAIIHIPRKFHQSVFDKFFRLLKPNGFALLCLGAEDIEEDIIDDYMGTQMYWSHFDSEKYIDMLSSCGFDILWSRVISDASYPEGPGHLFVMAEKPI